MDRLKGIEKKEKGRGTCCVDRTSCEYVRNTFEEFIRNEIQDVSRHVIWRLMNSRLFFGQGKYILISRKRSLVKLIHPIISILPINTNMYKKENKISMIFFFNTLSRSSPFFHNHQKKIQENHSNRKLPCSERNTTKIKISFLLHNSGL